MPTKPSLWKAQRAIVMQLLRDDHAALWKRSELRQQLPDISLHTFQTALELLEGDQCISFYGRSGILASLCARHLDELDLIGL